MISLICESKTNKQKLPNKKQNKTKTRLIDTENRWVAFTGEVRRWNKWVNYCLF